MRLLKTLALAGLLALGFAAPAAARGLEVWTDRGDDGVYEPGQAIQIKVRASEDGYLLVYAIDTEGGINVLYPARPGRAFIEGRRTYRIPSEGADVDLVVDDKVGQGFIVAIASDQPFRQLPWYLRPLDARGEDLGYANYDEADANDGVTEEGRIVGDPYVAMERIRRQVLDPHASDDDFTSAYTSYYVHQAVRYPRYVCYDCHRPGRWAWWDGFDPYYSSCRVIDFRVNWSWAWGPSCWHGFVPYYFYVVRSDCPPHYRHWYDSSWRWSSWDGWARWNGLWGPSLRRHKSAPPVGYNPPPSPGKPWNPSAPPPPGLAPVRRGDRGPDGIRQPTPIGRRERAPGSGGDQRPPADRGGRGGTDRPAPDRSPGRPSGDPGQPAPWRHELPPVPREPARPSDDGSRGSSRPEARPTPARQPERQPARQPDRQPERQPARQPDPPPAERPSARPAPSERHDSPPPPERRSEGREPARREAPSSKPAKTDDSGGHSRGGGRGGR